MSVDRSALDALLREELLALNRMTERLSARATHIAAALPSDAAGLTALQDRNLDTFEAMVAEANAATLRRVEAWLRRPEISTPTHQDAFANFAATDPTHPRSPDADGEPNEA